MADELPDHLVATFLFDYGNDLLQSFSMIYVVTGAEITIANIATVADALYSHFSPTLRACIPTTCSFWNLGVRFKTLSTDLEGYASDAGEAGTVASEVLPEYAAVCMRKRTSIPGRQNRGRLFFPCVPETFQNKGRLTDAAATTYKAFATLLDQDFVSAGVGMTFAPFLHNRKDIQLVRITQMQLTIDLCTRRDRAWPKGANWVAVT